MEKQRNYLRVVGDPVEEVIPGLEKAIEERDRQRAIAILRRFIPERYIWVFEELTKNAPGIPRNQ